MKTWTVTRVLGGIGCLLLISCEKPTEMTSDKTRELTTLDRAKVNLNPTSEERFTPSGSQPTAPMQNQGDSDSGFAFTADSSWTEKPSSQFRIVNFELPEGGELYVSASGGGILPNINRWLGQFQQQALTSEQFSKLDKIPFMGGEGYYVETSGDFSPGFGRPVKSNMVLAGVIAEVDGQIMTVKMIASPNVVTKNKEAFKIFCKTLKSK